MVSCRVELRRGGAGGSRKGPMKRKVSKPQNRVQGSVRQRSSSGKWVAEADAEVIVPHKLLKDIYDSDNNKVVGATKVDIKTNDTHAESDRQLQDTAPVVQTTLNVNEVVEAPATYLVTAAEVAQFAAVGFDELMDGIDMAELELDPAAASSPVYDESMWTEMGFTLDHDGAFAPNKPDGKNRDDDHNPK